MISSKNLNQTVTELFNRVRKTNISTVPIIKFDSGVPKDVRLNFFYIESSYQMRAPTNRI